METNCKHINWTVYNHNTLGWCQCNDCGREIPLGQCLQAEKARIDALEQKLNEAIAACGASAASQ